MTRVPGFSRLGEQDQHDRTHARTHARTASFLATLGFLATSSCSAPSETELRESATASLRVGTNVYVSGSTGLQQSEQSAIVAHQGANDVMLIAYNDYDSDPMTSVDGLARSSVINGGAMVWTPLAPLSPVGSPFELLQGDPWLVANSGDGSVVHYASLAKLSAAGSASQIGVASSGDGGQTWEPFVQASSTMCDDADKPSVETSADGKTVWVAYACKVGNTWSIRVAARVGHGAWGDAVVASPVLGGIASPIIKRDLVNTNVYVAWEDDAPSRRIVRFAQSGDLGATFDAPATPVDRTMNPDPVFDGFGGISVTNRIHFSFEIDPSNDHCVIAFDVNGAVYFTGTGDGRDWGAPVTVAADSASERYQPVLRGSPTRLAVSYYAQLVGGTPATIVFGKLSSDHGATWAATSDQLSALGGGFVTDGFQPCVVDPAGVAYCGDYIGLSPLWAPWQSFNDTLASRFFTAWADSRPSCIKQTQQEAVHQHTVGQLWGL